MDILEALEPLPGGMTAEQAARLALERAPAIASARAAELAASEQAQRTKLELIPRLDLSGAYTRYPDITMPDLEFGGTTVESPFPFLVNRYDLQANLSIGVTDIFLRILPSYEAAAARVDMRRYQTEAERVSTAYQARQSFYDVVLAEGTLAVAEDSVRTLESNHEDVVALAGAGVSTQSDVKRVEAQLAGVRVRRARAAANLDIARAAFRQLVAGGEPVETRSGEDLRADPGVQVPEADVLVSEALAQRPELLALRSLTEAEEHTTHARRSEMMPRLSIFGNGTYARPNQLIVPVMDEFRGSWQVGVKLAWSPNDLLTGRRSTREAEARVTQVREDLRKLQDGVIVEVTRALGNYEAARQAITSAREGLDAAELSYTTRRDLLEAGEATASELLEAETDLRQSQLDLLQAYVGLRRSLAAIDASVGRGLPDTNSRTAARP